jgi:hypothetical protein
MEEINAIDQSLVKKNKRLKTILILILIPLFLSLAFIIYVVAYNLNLETNEQALEDGAFITRVIEGEGSIGNNECLDREGCLVDILVRINNEEYILKNILIGMNHEVHDNIINNREGDEKFYLLDYGTGNERGAYIFNKNTISKTFCTTNETHILWNDKLIFNGCGQPGYLIELLTSIDILNINIGNVSVLFDAIPGQEEDTSYSVSRITEDNILEYYETTFSKTGDSIQVKKTHQLY